MRFGKKSGAVWEKRRKMAAGCGGCAIFFGGCVASRRNHKSLLLPSCQTHTDGFLNFEFHHFNRLLFFACYHTFQKIMQFFFAFNNNSKFKNGTSNIMHHTFVHHAQMHQDQGAYIYTRSLELLRGPTSS